MGIRLVVLEPAAAAATRLPVLQLASSSGAARPIFDGKGMRKHQVTHTGLGVVQTATATILLRGKKSSRSM
jgi:hypothetical protein